MKEEGSKIKGSRGNWGRYRGHATAVGGSRLLWIEGRRLLAGEHHWAGRWGEKPIWLQVGARPGEEPRGMK